MRGFVAASTAGSTSGTPTSVPLGLQVPRGDVDCPRRVLWVQEVCVPAEDLQTAEARSFITGCEQACLLPRARHCTKDREQICGSNGRRRSGLQGRAVRGKNRNRSLCSQTRRKPEAHGDPLPPSNGQHSPRFCRFGN